MSLNTALGAVWLPPGCRLTGGISLTQPPGRMNISRGGQPEQKCLVAPGRRPQDPPERDNGRINRVTR